MFRSSPTRAGRCAAPIYTYASLCLSKYLGKPLVQSTIDHGGAFRLPARLYDYPEYGFTVDELLGCLSDMATRDTQHCTTAVEHLFMICPCFLPPVPPVDDRRSESEREEAALESMRRLRASIRESRLRRAGNKRKNSVKVVDGVGEASSAAETGARQDR
jgi:hypothetical protein